MLEQALAAKIPILGVSTDDPLNVNQCLAALQDRSVQPWPTVKLAQKKLGPYLYVTDDPELATVETYRLLVAQEVQLVVVNAENPSKLIFDAGVLPTPAKLLTEYMEEFVDAQDIPPLLVVLKGLSLKTASEILQLTMAKTGSVLPEDVRRTRTLLGGSIQGLYPMETEIDFYQVPAEIEGWLQMNGPYFEDLKANFRLVPRGLMLAGIPGVGKTLGAKAMARFLGVPLYRLDIPTSLNKYIGSSEANIRLALQAVERESPCVMLIDEVEKIFTGGDDQGTTSRILSQLLWWLAEHRARVITVMTTNKLSVIPPELYRPGRVDRVITMQALTPNQAKDFSAMVYQSIIGKPPTMQHVVILRKTLDELNKTFYAHSDVAEITFNAIKVNNWYFPPT
jgi:hypothetical protein